MKKDKIVHIFAGAMVAAFIGLPAYLESGNLFAGLWACLAGVIAGCVKEWCDNEYGYGWNWRDLGWTCVGSLAAALLIILMHYAKG